METKEYLNVEDTIKIEESARCFRDKVFIHVLRRLGCRVSEALGIEIRHIDFKNSLITIIHEKVRVERYCPVCFEKGIKSRLSKNAHFCQLCGNNVEKLVENTKDDKEFRNLPVDSETMTLIKEHVSTMKYSKRLGDKNRLFKFTRQYAWRIIKDCGEKVGIQIINIKKQAIHHVHPHIFRDSFATNALNVDSSMEGVKRLQEHLGHSKIDTTMNYVRSSSNEHREWYEKVIAN